MRCPKAVPSQRSLVRVPILVGALVLGVLTIPRAGYSLFVREDAWASNGTVNAIAYNNNALYIGGSFSVVGPVSGPAAAIDYLTATAQKPYLRVTGQPTDSSS